MIKKVINMTAFRFLLFLTRTLDMRFMALGRLVSKSIMQRPTMRQKVTRQVAVNVTRISQLPLVSRSDGRREHLDIEKNFLQYRYMYTCDVNVINSDHSACTGTWKSSPSNTRIQATTRQKRLDLNV